MFNIGKALEIQLAFIELALEFFIAFDCLIFPELLNICFVRSDFSSNMFFELMMKWYS